MNIGRVGHYHVPGSNSSRGTCQLAHVTGPSVDRTWPLTEGEAPTPVAEPGYVNLRVYSHDGNDLGNRTSVPVESSPSVASFHLNQSCPYLR